MKLQISFMRGASLLLLLGTLLAVLVPFAPGLPMADIDSSWMLAMNQAVSQGLKFGKDIIFTLGPFASVYTHSYHPATDTLMMVGSLNIAMAYFLVICLLSRDLPSFWIVAYAIPLAVVPFSPDAVFFSYAFVSGLLIYKVSLVGKSGSQYLVGKGASAAVIFIFFTMGLLPLVKESILFACLPTVAGAAFLLIWVGKWKLALGCIAASAFGLVFYWMVGGQSLVDLPLFFIGMQPIVGGYTGGMSISGRPADIVLFCFGAAIVLSASWGVSQKGMRRAYVMGVTIVFLFLSFKAGFVRHDAHVIRSGVALVLSAFAIPFISGRVAIGVVPALATVFGLLICAPYVQLSTYTNGAHFVDTYRSAYAGLIQRVLHPDGLREQFDERMRFLSKEGGIEKVNGTSDIYPIDQAYLIASGNKWDPRPIIQSYSAYTSKLALANYGHLLGNKAPENIFFKVDPIDNRMPSLEDGVSWLALLRSYVPNNINGGYLLLKKSSGTVVNEESEDLVDKAYKMGQVVNVPDPSGGVIFVKLNIHKSILGHLVSALFKLPSLAIKVRLSDGEVRSYRIIADMAKSGFVISPLVTSARDFALLYGSPRLLDNENVVAISVESLGDGLQLWAAVYEVRMMRVSGWRRVDIDNMMGFQRPVAGRRELDVGQCEGNIDVINGKPGDGFAGKLGNLFAARGWLALSVQDGIVPDNVYLTFKSAQGDMRLLPTRRTSRPDVKQYFHASNLPVDVGFESLGDISSIPSGAEVVGLAYSRDGKLYGCPQFSLHLSKR